MVFPAGPEQGAEPFTLALDDADSGVGGCTTHLLGLLLTSLRGRLVLADYPLLVRLAPGVPWKTRGNAAVVIRGYYRGDPRELLEEALRLAEEYAAGRPREAGKGPGAALYRGVEPWREEWLSRLYREAVRGLVHWRAADKAAREAGVVLGGGRGRVGAVAALAALGPGEPYTFELIAYRRPERWGTERCVRHEPMLEAHVAPCAFNNVDLSTGSLVAAPHGPDPVLAGFRGTCPEALGCYSVFLCEEPHFWVLYRSNQHTDTHLTGRARLRPYESGRAKLILSSTPRRIPGGHIIGEAAIPGEGRVYVAAYRETGPLRRVLALMRDGSILDAGGTLHPRAQGLTLNLEKIFSAATPPRMLRLAPRCPRCGRRMKSMGRGKGYRCPKCGYRDPEATPITIHLPPPPAAGPVTPLPGALPHLVKPHYVSRLPSEPPPPPTMDMVLSLGGDPPAWTTGACANRGVNTGPRQI